MTADQNAEAQRFAREWKVTKYHIETSPPSGLASVATD